MAYRKIDAGIFGDEKFLKLSRPNEPNGQFLWFYLLAGRHTTGLPGLVQAGKLALAEALYWDQDLGSFDRVFYELIDLQLIRYDHLARLIYLPNSLRHNPPTSRNTIKAWKKLYDLVPDCDLKREWLVEADAYLLDQADAQSKGLSSAFREAFLHNLSKANGVGKGFGKALAKEEAKSEAKEEGLPCGNTVAKGDAKAYSGTVTVTVTDNDDDRDLLSSPENNTVQELIALGFDSADAHGQVAKHGEVKAARAAAWTRRRKDSADSNSVGYCLTLLRNHHLDPPPAETPHPSGPSPEELELRRQAAEQAARALAPEHEALESFEARKAAQDRAERLDAWFAEQDANTKAGVCREAMLLVPANLRYSIVLLTTGREYLRDAIDAHLNSLKRTQAIDGALQPPPGVQPLMEPSGQGGAVTLPAREPDPLPSPCPDGSTDPALEPWICEKCQVRNLGPTCWKCHRGQAELTLGVMPDLPEPKGGSL